MMIMIRYFSLIKIKISGNTYLRFFRLLGTDHHYQPLNDMAAPSGDRILHECQKFQFLTERQREMCKGDRMLTVKNS